MAKRTGRKKTSAKRTAKKRTPVKKAKKIAARSKATRQRRSKPAVKPASKMTTAATAARGVLAGAATEEKILYPALQSHPAAHEIVLEGFEEHHAADLIVKELQDVATNDEQWGAKFKVLKENIEHHIKEEEGQMFRIALRRPALQGCYRTTILPCSPLFSKSL
jgi:hypothetical protein